MGTDIPVENTAPDPGLSLGRSGRKMRWVVAAKVILLACVVIFFAYLARPVGPEFRVSQFSETGEKSPVVGMGASGKFVIAWESFDQDKHDDCFFAKRYNAFGRSWSGAFQVIKQENCDQKEPSVGLDASGNFVIAWKINYCCQGVDGIYAQRYDSSGNTLGSEFRVNSNTTGQKVCPSVGMNASGNFVVVWVTGGAYVGDQEGIIAQRYDANGTAQGSEFRVDTCKDWDVWDYRFPSVGMNASGNFVVVWECGIGKGYYVFARRFDAAGTAQGDDFLVQSANKQGDSPSVGMDASGNFVIALERYGWDPSIPPNINIRSITGNNIYAQRYDASGKALGSEFRVNTRKIENEHNPSLGMDASGNFVIAWSSKGRGDDGCRVFAKRYDASGKALGDEFQVSANKATTPSVGMDASGNFVIAWEGSGQDGGDNGIFARRFPADFVPPEAESSTEGNGEENPKVSWR